MMAHHSTNFLYLKTDIDECEDPEIRRLCDGECKNTEGSYYCQNTTDDSAGDQINDKASGCNDSFDEGSGCEEETSFEASNAEEINLLTEVDGLILETEQIGSTQTSTEELLSTTTLASTTKQLSELTSTIQDDIVLDTTEQISTTETTTLFLEDEETSIAATEIWSVGDATTASHDKVLYNYDDEDLEEGEDEYEEVTTVSSMCNTRGFQRTADGNCIGNCFRSYCYCFRTSQFKLYRK